MKFTLKKSFKKSCQHPNQDNWDFLRWGDEFTTYMTTLLVVPYGEMTIATNTHSINVAWAKACILHCIFQFSFYYLGCSFSWIDVPQDLHIQNKTYKEKKEKDEQYISIN